MASEWPGLCQALWIMQLIYCVWASAGLCRTDPAQLTTPLPSSCSWPLPPPVRECSPHPSARPPPSLPRSLILPPGLPPLVPLQPVGLFASLRWKPCQRRLSHTESSATLSSSWQIPQKHEPNHWVWHKNKHSREGLMKVTGGTQDGSNVVQLTVMYTVVVAEWISEWIMN